MPLTTGCFDYFPDALVQLAGCNFHDIGSANTIAHWLIEGSPDDITWTAEATAASLQVLQELLTGCPTLEPHRQMTLLELMRSYGVALMEVARLSKYGNDKHNAGEPIHWSRNKSFDHRDTIARHLLQYAENDTDDGMLHATKVAWRCLAYLQVLLEVKEGLPMSRGSKP